MISSDFLPRIRDIMRRDAGITNDAQCIEQLSWMLLLKIYDIAELRWEAKSFDFESLLAPQHLSWGDWAYFKSGKVKSGESLLAFVNNTLLPGLKNLEVPEDTPQGPALIKAAFTDVHNFRTDAEAFREVLAEIDQIDLTKPNEERALVKIYETMLQELQYTAGTGEFYTPRALTDFMAEHVQLQQGDRIADLACGTGGFLNSARRVLSTQVQSEDDWEEWAGEDGETLDYAFVGIENKPLPYLLCFTNLLLNGIDYPELIYGNALAIKNYVNYTKSDCFDVILMTPPLSGVETATVQNRFLPEERSPETNDLFLLLSEKRLAKTGGRAAVIVPDGLLVGGDNKTAIKQKLMDQANLHTIVRLPPSVFAPYTDIATNILFFDRSKPKTKETWFYRVDLPRGYKSFSQSKPFKRAHLKDLDQWWNSRKEIQDKNGLYKAKCYSRKEIEARGYNLDLCSYPK